MGRAGMLWGALIFAWACAPAHAALETILQDDANLIHRPTDQVRASMQRIKALGIDKVRLTANWSVLTRDADRSAPPVTFDARDPADYEQARWRGLDQAVGLAHEAGLDVLVDIGFWAPRWATTSGSSTRARANVDPEAFADFAVAVARRYDGSFIPEVDAAAAPEPSPDQTFLEQLLGALGTPDPPPPPPGPLPKVDEFALWNEPNHPGLLMPQWRGGEPASPGVYRDMVGQAYPAAKSARPDARFLVGNTSSMGGDGIGAVAPLRFIRELACVDRRLQPLATPDCASFTTIPGDGWAHHPYNRNARPDTRSSYFDDVWIGDLPKLSLLLRRLVARGRLSAGLRNIHITEFGYETRRIGSRPKVGLARQGRWLTWAEYLATRVPGVVSFAQFLLRDQPPASERVSESSSRAFGQFYTGLQTTAGVDKPAARTFTAGLFAQRRRAGRVLLWGRLRLGEGIHAVTVDEQRARGGGWRPRLQLQIGGQDSFERIVRAPAGVRYRMRWADQVGPPVAPVPSR